MMHIQVVAFPQEGIVREPGTIDLMEAAISMGCDVVGAITYQDADVREHLTLAANLAARHGLPLDVHADFGVPPESSALAQLIDVADEFGLSGRVAAGHCTTLARMESTTRDSLIEQLCASGISIVCLPRTDLFLDGIVAPFEELQRRGVDCHVATNNVRNAFTPVGRPSLPSVAGVCALATGIRSKAGLEGLARSLWNTKMVPGAHDVSAGQAADLCVWPVPEIWRLVADEPEPDIVLFNGGVVSGREPPQVD
jgi:cytosine deaminase